LEVFGMAGGEQGVQVDQFRLIALKDSADLGGVIEKNVTPQSIIACGDAGEVAEAGAGDGHRLVGYGVDQCAGQHMGQMADLGDEMIVLVGRHSADFHAELSPKLFDLLDRRGVG